MSDRAGFTMVEVLVAMALLGIALLSVQATLTSGFLTAVRGQDQEAVAHQIAQDGLERVRLHPEYLQLASLAEGPTAVPDHSRFLRRTVVVRTLQPRGTRQLDYTTITVSVTDRVSGAEVRRTAVVAAP